MKKAVVWREILKNKHRYPGGNVFTNKHGCPGGNVFTNRRNRGACNFRINVI